MNHVCEDFILILDWPSLFFCKQKQVVLYWPYFDRWVNTVLTCALANMIQHMHKGLQNEHAVDTAIILFAQCLLYLCCLALRLHCSIFAISLCNWMQCVDHFSPLLQRYVSNSWICLCYREKPVKCSTCAITQKVEIECFCRSLPILNDPVVRISRNLAKKIVQKPQKWSITKNLNFERGNF